MMDGAYRKILKISIIIMVRYIGEADDASTEKQQQLSRSSDISFRMACKILISLSCVLQLLLYA